MEENKTYEGEVVENTEVEETNEGGSGAGLGIILGGLALGGVAVLAVIGGITVGKKLKARIDEKKALKKEAAKVAEAQKED